FFFLSSRSIFSLGRVWNRAGWPGWVLTLGVLTVTGSGTMIFAGRVQLVQIRHVLPVWLARTVGFPTHVVEVLQIA
ncbi:hypothetical protein V8F06_009586, partial [Rhypophila decipiens]